VVPGVNDSIGDLADFAGYLGALRTPVELLPYHQIGAEKYRRLNRIYKLNGTPQPSAELMAHFAAALAESGVAVTIGA
jgi:pyruvate formate lyase activating enzyme